MASRMLEGRTLAVHQQLRDTSLFRPCETGRALKQELYPAAGLTALHKQEPVLIVHTFQRRNIWMAHVAPIAATQARNPPQGAEAVLQRRRALTCVWKELEDVCLSWQVVGFVRDSVYLKRFDSAAAEVHCVHSILETWDALSSVAATCLHLPSWAQEDKDELTEGLGAIEVLSLEAAQHVDQNPGHHLVAREHRVEPVFLLDVPAPKLLDMRPRRCQTCAKAGVSRNFKPGPDDVARAVPDIVVYRGAAHAKRFRFMTSTYLVWLLQNIYATFNLRTVRRRLLDSAHTCMLERIARGRCRVSPTSIGALALALPTAEELRAIALKAFSVFVEEQVGMLIKRQALYNMSIVRGDGHYDLASRVLERDPGHATGQRRPYTCILAWCGTDGSLLKPFVLKPGESFEDQAKDLEPYLQTAKGIRMAFGMDWAASRPTVHATDTYNKHRNLWPKVYDRVWKAQEIGFDSEAAKGDVRKINRQHGSQVLDTTLVTGEPMHDLINLRRALPNLGQDFADIYFDHAVP